MPLWRPILLLRISFPGRPIFIQSIPVRGRHFKLRRRRYLGGVSFSSLKCITVVFGFEFEISLCTSLNNQLIISDGSIQSPMNRFLCINYSEIKWICWLMIIVTITLWQILDMTIFPCPNFKCLACPACSAYCLVTTIALYYCTKVVTLSDNQCTSLFK